MNWNTCQRVGNMLQTSRVLHHNTSTLGCISNYHMKCNLPTRTDLNFIQKRRTQTSYFSQKLFENYAQRTSLFCCFFTDVRSRFPSIITSQRRDASSKRSSKKAQYYAEKGHSSRTKLYYTLKQYIRSPENAETFVSHLKEEERRFLLAALESSIGINTNSEQHGEDSGQITKRQLYLVFVHNCIPFIGFGFLDNAIMILAGEYIDLTIGVTLGISTMAAAALGNTISDIAGIGLAGYVESLFYKLGLPVPALTPEQAEQNSTIFSSNAGKAFGILIGCIVGMFPLLFIAKEEKEDG
uniref:transmembrane protein 65-like n=2 Tax=Styela clava TaxID=7725 RepID=UPI00193A9D71|nr:transmembrane protein 65-like [Styela clava]